MSNFIIRKEWETKSGNKAVVAQWTIPHMNHNCGYVGVTRESRLFGVDYKKLDFDIHGGITFSDRLDEKSDIWWVGFNCAHPGDTPEKCNLDFCIKECESLGKQIQEWEELKK